MEKQRFIISSQREGRWYCSQLTQEEYEKFRKHPYNIEMGDGYFDKYPSYLVEGSVTGKIGDEIFGELQTQWARNTDRNIPTLSDLDKVFVPISETDYLLSSKANKKRLEESASTYEALQKIMDFYKPTEEEAVENLLEVEPESNGGLVEKLTLALKLMKERRHEVAGLGAPIQIITEVLASLNNRLNP